jgi:prophage antirepressor-like protein
MANESNSLQLQLRFEDRPVRCVGTAERPEWVVADVGDVLGIKNVRQVLANFDEDEKGVCIVYTLGGNQSLVTVYEAGLYKLISKSRKPEAKKFQRWVFHEVLPSIRKHGTYPPPDTNAVALSQGSTGDAILDNLRHVQLAIQVTFEMRERQLAVERAQNEIIRQICATHQLALAASTTARAALDQSTSNHGHYTVLGYAKLQGWEMPVAKASAHGRKLSAICANRGIVVGTMTDPRFGRVNTYPESVLKEYFGDSLCK